MRNPLTGRPITAEPAPVKPHLTRAEREAKRKSTTPAAPVRLAELNHMTLVGLQSKPVYQGTVPRAVVDDRRARNRAASVSRRTNRRGK